MNIFVLDEDPAKAAVALNNNHICKLSVEAAQLLCNVHHWQGVDAPMRETHINHPCSIWVRSSLCSYLWTLDHAFAICYEAMRRGFKEPKTLQTLKWLRDNEPFLPDKDEPFALAMPDDCKTGNAVESYRCYYNTKRFRIDGKRMDKWTNCSPPDWWLSDEEFLATPTSRPSWLAVKELLRKEK